MNQEYIYIWTTLIKLIALGIITMQYSAAGRGWGDGKWYGRRRVFVPIILCLTWLMSALILQVFSLKLVGFLIMSGLIYYLCMSVGYGGNTFWEKIGRRLLYGLLLGCSPLLIAYYTGNWALYLLGICVSVGRSGVLGVWNLPKNAVYEETLIAIGSFTIPLFLI